MCDVHVFFLFFYFFIFILVVAFSLFEHNKNRFYSSSWLYDMRFSFSLSSYDKTIFSVQQLSQFFTVDSCVELFLLLLCMFTACSSIFLNFFVGLCPFFSAIGIINRTILRTKWKRKRFSVSSIGTKTFANSYVLVVYVVAECIQMSLPSLVNDIECNALLHTQQRHQCYDKHTALKRTHALGHK